MIRCPDSIGITHTDVNPTYRHFPFLCISVSSAFRIRSVFAFLSFLRVAYWRDFLPIHLVQLGEKLGGYERRGKKTSDPGTGYKSKTGTGHVRNGEQAGFSRFKRALQTKLAT